jgi:hypothetical protein
VLVANVEELDLGDGEVALETENGMTCESDGGDEMKRNHVLCVEWTLTLIFVGETESPS